MGLLLGLLGLLGLLALGAGAMALAGPRARRWWADETPRPDEDERGVSSVEMTLVEHLYELRKRLIIALAALTATTAGAFAFHQRWMDVALWPVRGHELQAITPTETVWAYFTVTLVVGLILAMPVIAYQVWAYVAPGLTRRERRYVVALVPGVTLSFVAGVLFAYLALLPAALAFLLGFGSDVVEVKPTIASYIAFLTRLLVAIGLVFQIPVVLFFLAKVGLVSATLLGSIRRYVIVAAVVVGAVVTPTPDPFNQLLVAVPVLVLYEIGVLLARWASRGASA